MRATSLFLFLLTALVLTTGCGGGPREGVIDTRSAKADRRVMRVKIIETYNNHRMEYTTEPRVGWVIDVDVVQGPANLIGTSMTLPYDDFALGPPPEKGAEVTITPADWMTPPGIKKYRMRDR